MKDTARLWFDGKFAKEDSVLKGGTGRLAGIGANDVVKCDEAEAHEKPDVSQRNEKDSYSEWGNDYSRHT